MGQQAGRQRKSVNTNKMSANHSGGFQPFQNSVGNYIIQSGVAEQAGCDFTAFTQESTTCLNSHLSSTESKCF